MTDQRGAIRSCGGTNPAQCDNCSNGEVAPNPALTVGPNNDRTPEQKPGFTANDALGAHSEPPAAPRCVCGHREWEHFDRHDDRDGCGVRGCDCQSFAAQRPEARTGEAPEPHPWYGSCDGFGPGRECSECAKTRFQSEDEWLVWLRSESPDEMASLRARLRGAERERDEARRALDWFKEWAATTDTLLDALLIWGGHNADCWHQRQRDPESECFCGWDYYRVKMQRARAALAARPAETPEGR